MNEPTTEMGKALAEDVASIKARDGLPIVSAAEASVRIIAIEQEAYERGRDYGFDTAQSFHGGRANADRQLVEALQRLVKDVIDVKMTDGHGREPLNWGEVNVSLDRAESALRRSVPVSVPVRDTDPVDPERENG